jgi:hypothetical protein
MKRIKLLFVLMGAGLRLLYLYLSIRPKVMPYYPYLRIGWKHRQEARTAWGEVQAMRRLI